MNKHFLIVEARYYTDISDMLVQGAIEEIGKYNCSYEIVSVPGCFEIATAIKMAVELDIYDGFIALGCVIRGQTTHYDYVCSESARGINQISMDYAIPVGYGIITTENHEQAIIRADKNQKNKGGFAAKAAIEMFQLSEFFISKLEGYDKDLIDTN